MFQREPSSEGYVAGVLGGVAGGVAHLSEEREFKDPQLNTESYEPLVENPFLRAVDNPVSTFSIDVDTASYSIVRRFIRDGQLPPRDSVRIEELINYFPYEDAPPAGDEPFSVSIEMAGCPWSSGHRLARIGLKGREIMREAQPGRNLVFLLDVSGSMASPAKLPLVKSALTRLVRELDGRDDVSIVVYAGASGLILPTTRGDAKSEILQALDRLEAGGSTNGGEGLELAYRMAHESFVPGGINRVILATDGDFNVGITDKGKLLRFIEDEARKGVFLTVLGFGMGNYKDDMLEMLADHGNGNYAYIDSLREARKVLVEQIGATMMTIAKDVKIQVEFNPARVGAYRLIGYENRLLRPKDFNDDSKDAGEIGAGHTVTALYELVPPDAIEALPVVDALKYQTVSPTDQAVEGREAFTVKLRYKEPDSETSRLLTYPVEDAAVSFESASDSFRFSAAVAAFGMILRESENRGSVSLDQVLEIAQDSLGEDEGGYRQGFIELVRSAEPLLPGKGSAR